MRSARDDPLGAAPPRYLLDAWPPISERTAAENRCGNGPRGCRVERLPGAALQSWARPSGIEHGGYQRELLGRSGSSSGRVSPVSSRVLRLARMAGQPPLMLSSTVLPGSKPSCTTVSLTFSPSGSMSKVTFDRGSLLTLARNSSLNSKALASSGVKVCQE